MSGLRAGMGDGKRRAVAGQGSGSAGGATRRRRRSPRARTRRPARAVDVALSAATAVLDGEPMVYGLCRPPGHHAARRRCTAATASSTTRRSPPTTSAVDDRVRVAVLDVDYHHGNGTQQIFYERDDVAFVSLHGDPSRAYPYHTGFADEIGAGRGQGSTTNVPLPAGRDDDRYLAALDEALDAVDGFDPAVVVVSLGVDTYGGDPICDLAVTTDGFGRCGAAVAALVARSSCSKKAVTPTTPSAPTSSPGSPALPTSPPEIRVLSRGVRRVALRRSKHSNQAA